jgi:hypothetical protein
VTEMALSLCCSYVADGLALECVNGLLVQQWRLGEMMSARAIVADALTGVKLGVHAQCWTGCCSTPSNTVDGFIVWLVILQHFYGLHVMHGTYIM